MATSPHHLLVIDDEPFIAHIIEMQFSRGPFRVSSAADGASALAFLRAHRDVALILVDVNLPGLSGLDVMEEARREPDLARVPWLVLTATGQKAHLERARSLGAAAVVTKPFSPNKLYHQVCELLGEPAGPVEEPT
jgi:CheY-like chemotaxis protein